MHADVIILGLGAMGAAAADALSRRGWSVLGFEQFMPGHSRGSSHGHTRIIRTAYYEHPTYVPLVRRAFELWYDLEQRTGTHLLTRCECLTVGLADGVQVPGVRSAAATHHLNIDEFTADELRKTYPGLVVPPGAVGLREHEAGFLYVTECVRAMQQSAATAGAKLHFEDPVLDWNATETSVTVRTASGTHTAEKLLLTAGAWATEQLAQLNLSVMRQTLLWFRPRRPELFRRDRFPIFMMEDAFGDFYGLPMIDARGVKVARHYGAQELAHPREVDWTVTDADVAQVRHFLDRAFPGQFEECTGGEVCMYTLSPDRHFRIGATASPRVAAAAGFSGHGFKFAPVVGERLADWCQTGKLGPGMELFDRLT
ncbi:MAG: N-methyl-L-tryptophan oxidase [Gemmataceae bacterium]